MKNIFLLALTAILVSFTTSKETITLSGKILNSEEAKIILYGEGFEKQITLKTDGSFSESFQIDYCGIYALKLNANTISLYLTKGTQLIINADGKKFAETLKLTGKGSLENSYYIEKTKLGAQLLGNPQEFYTLEETPFLVKLKEIKTALTNLYSKTKFNDNTFKKNEEKNIYFFEQLQLLNYPQYHAHYAKKEGFTPTSSFPKEDKSLDLDNEDLFLFSTSYQKYVSTKFSNSLYSKLGDEANYTYTAALPEIKKLKSQAIKNAYLRNLGYEISAENKDIEMLYSEINTLSTDTKFKQELNIKYNKVKSLTPGKISPQFDYENYKGGKTSLESLKGKYVYIDVWATWCGPCRKEIPSLQKVEEQYYGKNIEFISLSIDAKKDYEKWRKMVEEKNLGGIQLFADNDWSSKFVTDYAIEGIPRFILVDPSGNIVSSDAPRPSDPKLIEKLTELGIK